MKPSRLHIINRSLQYDNLRDCAAILDSLGVKWVLFYGTLLGAVREEDILQGDWDGDLLLIDIKRDEVSKIASMIIEKGFEGWHEVSNPACFSRGTEYVDIYRTNKNLEGIYKSLNFCFDSKFFQNLKKGKIGNNEYPIPDYVEELVEILYGFDWRTKKEHSALSTKKLYGLQ